MRRDFVAGENDVKKTIAGFLTWCYLSCCLSAEMLTGEISWSGFSFGFPVVGYESGFASFTFDTAVQRGTISDLWGCGDFAGGNCNFTASTVVTSHEELVDFDVVQWAVYEEVFREDESGFSTKSETLSGVLHTDNINMEHWVLEAPSSMFSGTFSVIPEPTSVLLFSLGLSFVVVIKRMKIRTQSDLSLGK
jgi:hypothetical protein